MKKNGMLEISFSDLLNAVRFSWRLTLLVTMVCTTVAIALVIIVPKKYEASTLIAVQTADSVGNLGGALNSLSSQFGGLAAIAGIATPTDGKKSESLAVLQSEELTELYIKDNNLLPILFASEWDESAHRWRSSDSKRIPTLWKGNALFRKSIRAVSVDPKTGLATLTITWKDPLLASSWANGLVRLTDSYLRQKAIDQAERNIAYLNEQASKTETVGVKQAIYALMQSEISKAMLARGSNEFALKVIDRAFTPEKPAFPKPILWVVIGFIFGLLLSIFIGVIRYAASGGAASTGI